MLSQIERIIRQRNQKGRTIKYLDLDDIYKIVHPRIAEHMHMLLKYVWCVFQDRSFVGLNTKLQ